MEAIHVEKLKRLERETNRPRRLGTTNSRANRPKEGKGIKAVRTIRPICTELGKAERIRIWIQRNQSLLKLVPRKKNEF